MSLIESSALFYNEHNESGTLKEESCGRRYVLRPQRSLLPDGGR